MIVKDNLRPYLHAFDFENLFVEGLGWDYCRVDPQVVHVGGRAYTLQPVAKKAEFVVYECDSSVDNNIPQYPVRRKIESQVAKLAFEHIVIFTDPDRKTQIWQWVKREGGKPLACPELRLDSGQSGDHLLQPLQRLAFSLEEEGRLNISEVASRVRKAFDVEKVTKRFYERFRTEIAAFQDFIEGISAQGDRDWYASLMLNRMMFIYFIQKQRFLDGDPDYLRERLRIVQKQAGPGQFHQFYRLFLLRLFHEGLGQPQAEREPDLADLLGDVPFLNGGLFDVHDLERDNPDISIPDQAFERVFDFFDAYRWHLDERPVRQNNEINPDVLGYIFEKYVNQKQMGAYYTKEDITGYIGRSAIIPFLLDAAKKECQVAFAPDGGVWRLLQDVQAEPDRYIYPAVGHGIAWNARQAEDPKPLDAPFDLPDDIAAGIHDVSKRGNWNQPAPDEYALPTETWREVVARRQRYADTRAKLASGQVNQVNDLVTLNLDVERFAKNVITHSEGPELLRAFWHALKGVSVLDPTCGSGAFLFAALNILEPLYTACLEGMQGFLDDLERSERPRSPKALSDFREVLDQVEKHPSERYFILKSIVLDNLYGVDIMEEAVEICKLRLFLKLVAQLKSRDQIEPLPDIDFNIRAGNTLVGFTSLDAVRQAMTITPSGQYRAMDAAQQETLERIKEKAEIASRAFNQFRAQQTKHGGKVTPADKAKLRRRLETLSRELDRYLAAEYGIDPADQDAYQAWQTSHQPFHWFAEFYGIMNDGGFDVIIGNPPYVEYSKVRKEYQIRGFVTERCGNLYAFCMERSNVLKTKYAYFGMITPISITSAIRMESLRDIYATQTIYSASFADRPSALFAGVHQILSIVIVAPARYQNANRYSAGFNHWSSQERDSLMQSLYYSVAPVDAQTIWHKVGNTIEHSILLKIEQNKNTVTGYFRSHGQVIAICGGTGGYWLRTLNGKVSSAKYSIRFVEREDWLPLCAFLNSNTFYWFWRKISNCRDLNNKDIARINLDLDDELRNELAVVGAKHLEVLKSTQEHRVGGLSYDQYRPANAKSEADEIDRVLAEHYGFTDEELDFIINYDIKYRMGIS